MSLPILAHLTSSYPRSCVTQLTHASREYWVILDLKIPATDPKSRSHPGENIKMKVSQRWTIVRWLSLSILISWLYPNPLLFQMDVVIGGFVPVSVTKRSASTFVPCFRKCSWQARALENDESETLNDSSEAANLWSYPSPSATSFNPFAYDASSAAAARPGWLSSQPKGLNTNVISLRSTRMKEITNEMLNEFPNHDRMLLVLHRSQEFLLEPLEDDMAVQDVDSIYRHCTNRTERYRRFEQSMMDRLRSVRDESVRQVLTMLKDFVLSHEHS
jgi:hypothetical protein